MYVLAKKFGNEEISEKDGFSEVPYVSGENFTSSSGQNSSRSEAKNLKTRSKQSPS